LGCSFASTEAEGNHTLLTTLCPAGFCKQFIYRIISRAKGSPLKTKKITGRPVVMMSPKSKRNLKEITVGKVAKSYSHGLEMGEERVKYIFLT